ncbi:hypothetical protein BDR06DRAFT_665243 [Suillus hirtellus]|nr:hypothetical protein BDR06DRAFT_665243 [Suillus hirtellus]
MYRMEARARATHNMIVRCIMLSQTLAGVPTLLRVLSAVYIVSTVKYTEIFFSPYYVPSEWHDSAIKVQSTKPHRMRNIPFKLGVLISLMTDLDVANFFNMYRLLLTFSSRPSFSAPYIITRLSCQTYKYHGNTCVTRPGPPASSPTPVFSYS